MIYIKTPTQIAKIRASCKIVASVLKLLKKEALPGTTTQFLNNLAEDLCLEKGGIPGFKNYNGFPYALCCSKNNTVVHGFPDEVPLEEGDILSLDFGARYEGYYGDAAITLPIGKVSEEASELIRTTHMCLHYAVHRVKPNIRFGDISGAIERKAMRAGYSIIEKFTGHGVGRDLHEEPQIPNFSNGDRGGIVKPGMVFAIEPIVCMGNNTTHTEADHWSVRVPEGSLCAHFEHTVLVTETGVEVLTSLI